MKKLSMYVPGRTATSLPDTLAAATAAAIVQKGSPTMSLQTGLFWSTSSTGNCRSTDPMSQLVPTGRGLPRWSFGAQVPLLPLSTAGPSSNRLIEICPVAALAGPQKPEQRCAPDHGGEECHVLLEARRLVLSGGLDRAPHLRLTARNPRITVTLLRRPRSAMGLSAPPS